MTERTGHDNMPDGLPTKSSNLAFKVVFQLGHSLTDYVTSLFSVLEKSGT